MTSPTPSVLTLQSHVAYGRVGNRAAVLPLERLGFEPIVINTVQFSNHTGYGSWTGEVFSPEHVAALLDGIEAQDGFSSLAAVLTGYMGDAALGHVVVSRVKRLKAQRPGLKWVCDPVMGDVGRGLFVRPNIPAFFADHALPLADVITPNHFELEILSGMTVTDFASAARACELLHGRGPDTILVTSFARLDRPEGTVEMLASHRDGRRYLVSTPRIPLAFSPNGSGDFTAALFCAMITKGLSLHEALARTAAGILVVFEETARAGTRELALIAAQDRFRNASPIAVTALSV